MSEKKKEIEIKYSESLEDQQPMSKKKRDQILEDQPSTLKKKKKKRGSNTLNHWSINHQCQKKKRKKREIRYTESLEDQPSMVKE